LGYGLSEDAQKQAIRSRAAKAILGEAEALSAYRKEVNKRRHIVWHNECFAGAIPAQFRAQRRCQQGGTGDEMRWKLSNVEVFMADVADDSVVVPDFDARRGRFGIGRG